MISGEAKFEPTPQDIRLYNSTGTYKVCEERIRWNPSLLHLHLPNPRNNNFPNSSSCCQENNKLTEGCAAQREAGCTEIFGGITALQALPGFGGQSTLVPRRCPGCPFSCPRTMPCRVPIRSERGVRCCKPIGLGRSSGVLGCPFRCLTWNYLLSIAMQIMYVIICLKLKIKLWNFKDKIKLLKRNSCYFCIYGKYDCDSVLLLISGGYYLALMITFPSQLLSRIKIR